MLSKEVKTRFNSPVVAHELPDILDRVELAAFGRECDDADIGGHHALGGGVPTGLIHQDDRVRARPYGQQNFGKVQRHNLCLQIDSLRGAPQAKKAWPGATSLEDITALVHRIDVPTLVISGANDRIDTPATLEAELLPRIPHATLHILPDTGHLSPLEAPAALAMLIAGFVDRLN